MNEIKIRNATFDDSEELLKIYAYYIKNTAITFECDIPTLDEFKNRIAETKKKYPYIIAELNNEIAGYAYAGSFIERAAYNWSAELTIYLNNKLKGLGIGGTLYKKLEDELKNMGILNLYACIGYPEIEDEYLTMNSVHFHEHLGFKIVGHFKKCGYKFNNWYDMVWMEKIVGEHVENMKPVKFKEQ